MYVHIAFSKGVNLGRMRRFGMGCLGGRSQGLLRVGVAGKPGEGLGIIMIRTAGSPQCPQAWGLNVVT